MFGPATDHDRRLARRRDAPRADRPQVGGRRPRAGGRLRHRPVRVPGAERGPRDAVGGGPRAVPALRRSRGASCSRPIIPTAARSSRIRGSSACSWTARSATSRSPGCPPRPWKARPSPTAWRASTPSPRSPSSPAPGPARLLGLASKGHLGPGADADVTIYTPDADVERMFTTPRYVLKAGVRVVEDGQLRREVRGRTLSVAPEHDPAVERVPAGSAGGGRHSRPRGLRRPGARSSARGELERRPHPRHVRRGLRHARGARLLITARSPEWARTAGAVA